MLSLFFWMRGNEYKFDVKENESELKHYIKISDAYSTILDRVYVDHTDYFNDVLMESDEYYQLDSLINNPY